jgi:hypothetical protein
MLTLQIVATASNIHNDQIPPIIFVGTSVYIYPAADNLANSLAKSVLYIIRRIIGLIDTPRRNVTNLGRNLMIGLPNIFWTIKERT